MFAILSALFLSTYLPSPKRRALKTILSSEINKIERICRHDLIAFLENVNSYVGAAYSPYIHKGLTSSDVIDTAFALQIRDSSKIILENLDKLKIDDYVIGKGELSKDSFCHSLEYGNDWMIL